jgi:P-type E1-E2 ATPase
MALKARVLRDGEWKIIPARELVPGDIIRLRMGDIVPADVKLIEGEYLTVDESALTGESLPVEKKVGDIAFSGSLIKKGEMTAVVIWYRLEYILRKNRTARGKCQNGQFIPEDGYKGWGLPDSTCPHTDFHRISGGHPQA